MEMFQSSTVARFSIAIVISSLITSATFSPLVFHLTRSVPVVRARPQAAVVLPPSISGIYPDPEPCRGNCSWVHDPSIVYDDNKYWRFTTSGNIAISTSRFLQGPWKYQGALLHNGTSIHLRDDQDIWVWHFIFPHPCMITKISSGTFDSQARRNLVLPLLRLLHWIAAL